jgi:hypothetical protein
MAKVFLNTSRPPLPTGAAEVERQRPKVVEVVQTEAEALRARLGIPAEATTLFDARAEVRAEAVAGLGEAGQASSWDGSRKARDAAVTSLAQLDRFVPLRQGTVPDEVLDKLSPSSRVVAETHWQLRVPKEMSWSVANYLLGRKLETYSSGLDDGRDVVRGYGSELKAVAEADLKARLLPELEQVMKGDANLSSVVTRLGGSSPSEQRLSRVLRNAAVELQGAARKQGISREDKDTLNAYADGLNHVCELRGDAAGFPRAWLGFISAALSGPNVGERFLKDNADIAPLILGLKDTGQLFEIGRQLYGLPAGLVPPG